jgi:hypothetical protein
MTEFCNYLKNIYNLEVRSMARYKEYNQAQGQFIPIDFDSKIREGTFKYAFTLRV